MPLPGASILISCRHRRVKCDGARPECQRCRTSARACTGYRDPEPLTRQSRNHRFAFKIVHPAIQSASALRLSSRDVMRYDYFVNVAVPSIKQLTLHPSWLDEVVFLSASDECLKTCAIAFAAVHQSRNEYRQQKTTVEQVTVQSLPSHNRAISLMRSRLTETPIPGPAL